MAPPRIRFGRAPSRSIERAGGSIGRGRRHVRARVRADDRAPFRRRWSALDSAADLLPVYPDGRARAVYYRAVLDGETGDVRAALASARAAREAATRLGLDAVRRNAVALGAALTALGRTDDALHRLEEVRDRELDTLSACEQGELLANIGWVALQARDASANGATLNLAESSLERAADLAATRCPSGEPARRATQSRASRAPPRRPRPHPTATARRGRRQGGHLASARVSRRSTRRGERRSPSTILARRSPASAPKRRWR